MTDTSTPALDHDELLLPDARLHYVRSGRNGSTVLLVHGFPETWRAFERVIPSLAEHHRVVAVDLRGFGGSRSLVEDFDSDDVARDLLALIEHLGHQWVHVVGQDIAGGAVFRLATQHPDRVRSLTAIEMGLAGYGLEAFADVTSGGSWHIGALAAPGVPRMLLEDKALPFVSAMIRGLTADQAAIGEHLLGGIASDYARPGGFDGAAALYRSMLREGAELRELAERSPLTMPVLAIGAGGGGFTAETLEQVARGAVEAAHLDGVGHYAAMEAPTRVVDALLPFLARVDASALAAGPGAV